MAGSSQSVDKIDNVVEDADSVADDIFRHFNAAAKLVEKSTERLATPVVEKAIAQVAEIGAGEGSIAKLALKTAEYGDKVSEFLEKVEAPATVVLGAAKATIEIEQGQYKSAAGTAAGTATAIAAIAAGTEVGTSVGLAAGSLLGSVVPVLGTVAGGAVGAAVGGAVGNIAGGIAGYVAGNDLGQMAYADVAKPAYSKAVEAYDVIKDGAIGTSGLVSSAFNWIAGGNNPKPEAAPVLAANTVTTPRVSAAPFRL